MKIPVMIPNHEYDIILERGALAHLADYVKIQGKVLLITDTGVPQAHIELVSAQLADCDCYIVEQGEGSKSFTVLQKILSYMLAHDFQRSDCVIALGGGVVGDLAGFAASIYMRGIRFINFPTTTLAQIDSSIGGKTAINLVGVKNVIGAFYQPSLVIIDPEVLKTLDHRQIVSGLAEALKAGLIADAKLFALFSRADPMEEIETIIYRSLLVKKHIVEQDEKETGLRKLLNFGHTIGHGIEACYLDSLYHGEAVALGMLYFIENESLKEQVIKIYEKLGLPSTCDYEKEAVFTHIAHDKKASKHTIDVVVVSDAGKSHIEKMSFDEIKARL